MSLYFIISNDICWITSSTLLINTACLSSPCQHNGTCIEGINAYTCNCMPGFTGQQCETSNIVTILYTLYLYRTLLQCRYYSTILKVLAKQATRKPRNKDDLYGDMRMWTLAYRWKCMTLWPWFSRSTVKVTWFILVYSRYPTLKMMKSTPRSYLYCNYKSSNERSIWRKFDLEFQGHPSKSYY